MRAFLLVPFDTGWDAKPESNPNPSQWRDAHHASVHILGVLDPNVVSSVAATDALARNVRKSITPNVRDDAVASNAVIAPADRERSIFVALEKNDIAAFNEALGADFMFVGPEGAMKWERGKSAELLKGCKTGKQTLSNVTSTPQGDDVMIVTYTAAGEQICNGKKAPSAPKAKP